MIDMYMYMYIYIYIYIHIFQTPALRRPLNLERWFSTADASWNVERCAI